MPDGWASINRMKNVKHFARNSHANFFLSEFVLIHLIDSDRDLFILMTVALVKL